MKIEEIIKKVKSLKLDPNTYIVMGSCPMAIYNLREVNDIDLVVAEGVFDKLKKAGWGYGQESINAIPLSKGVFEVFTGWNFGSYKPTLTKLLKKAVIVDGVPFSPIGEVRKWKSILRRPQDIADIKLIDDYLNN